MGCGISSNSPVVTKRLAGRTSRVEDCSPLEKTNSTRAHSSTSINSVEHRDPPANIYSSTSNYLKDNDPTKKSPSSDSPDPLIDQQKYNSTLLAKNRRGITAVLSKTLSNNSKSIDQLEGESDRQTGKESVETNNSRNDSNYGSYSAEMSKTPVSFLFFFCFLFSS